MLRVLDNLPQDLKRRLKERAQPEWIDPMLATLTRKHFSDNKWIFERKFDGERCLVFKKGENIFMRSRNLKKRGISIG